MHMGITSSKSKYSSGHSARMLFKMDLHLENRPAEREGIRANAGGPSICGPKMISEIATTVRAKGLLSKALRDTHPLEDVH